jgi:hypothetical protein
MSDWKLWEDEAPPSDAPIEANLGPAKLGYLGLIKDPRKFELMFHSMRAVYWRSVREELNRGRVSA